MYKIKSRSQKVQSPAGQAEALRNTFRAHTTQLRQTVRDFFTNRYNKTIPDTVFVPHMMNSFEGQLGKFRRYNLGKWRKFSCGKQIQCFTSANAIAKTLNEWCGVSRFVISQPVVTKLLRLQAGKGREEIGGYCRYRIFIKNGKKIILLSPHIVPTLKTWFDKSGTPYINIDAPQTREYGVVFHVHIQDTTPRPSGGDLLVSRHWKPDLVLNHYKDRGIADLAIPYLLHLAPGWLEYSYAQGSYVHVDILAPEKLRALLKSEELTE